MNIKKVSENKGFTLIEILVVIGIIAILAAIVIIAINPTKQFAQARNTERVANTNAILNAVGQRLADNRGVFAGTFTIGATTYTCGLLPTTAGSGEETITNDMAANTTAETGDLGCLIPTYISALPEEPTEGADYTIEVLANGRVQVCAPEMLEEDSLPDLVTGEECVTR